MLIEPFSGQSFCKGLYGLEDCSVRGKIIFDLSQPLYITKLSLQFTGKLQVHFVDMLEYHDLVKRSKILFDQSTTLLTKTTFEPGLVELPFEIPFPYHEPVSAGFGASPELLPNPTSIKGTCTHGHSYSVSISYTLSAIMIESQTPFEKQSFFSFWSPKPQIASVSIPFKIYDPRLLLMRFNADARRWRSAPNHSPIEYDIEITSFVLGPEDSFRVAYRLILDPELARQGVRIARVSFCLKEVHFIGEDRCCSLDDDGIYHLHHIPASRTRATRDILNWDQTEYFSEEGLELMSQKPCKLELTRPGTFLGNGDGIYVESFADLKMPSIGGFLPSTARPFIYQGPCLYNRPRPAAFLVRHTVAFTIHFLGASSITFEAPAYLCNISKQEANTLIDHDPEILPTLDYEKVIGLEVWVPPYPESPVKPESPTKLYGAPPAYSPPLSCSPISLTPPGSLGSDTVQPELLADRLEELFEPFPIQATHPSLGDSFESFHPLSTPEPILSMEEELSLAMNTFLF